MINELFHSLLLQLSEVLPMATSASSNKRTSKSDADLALLDKLVTTLLERKATESSSSSPSSSQASTMQRLRPLSRSLSRSLRLGSFKRNNNNNTTLPTIAETGGSGRRLEQPSVKNALTNVLRNAPQRFSTANDEEARNILD